MSYEYSEDYLIEQTAIELFHDRLGWDMAMAYNKEIFGENANLVRVSVKDVILARIFIEKLKDFNPGLPQSVYKSA